MRISIWTALAMVYASFGVSHGADPIISEGLTVYYGFDSVDENGLFPDGSANNLPGLITFGFDDAGQDDLDDIVVDKENFIAGGGSARFDTDPNIKEDYIAICDPINQPDHNDGCGEILDDRPSYVHSTGFTVAAWMNVEDVGADHSVYQSRAGGGGFIHTQVQGGGGLRFRLRGDANSDNIVQYNEAPDGELIPFEEWFHYAGTYQKGDDPEEPGEWAIYYNGEEVAGGQANGGVAGDPDLEVLGDWGQGAFIGLVPDFNRQLVGNIDEFYLFNRGLSSDEIQKIFKGEVPNPCDINGDGEVNAADIDAHAAAGGDVAALVGDPDCFHTYIGDANLDGEFNSGDFVAVFQAGKYETGNPAGWAEGDWNGDGVFDSGDFVVAFQGGGFELGPLWQDPAGVPEPSASLLLVFGMIALGIRRKKSN